MAHNKKHQDDLFIRVLKYCRDQQETRIRPIDLVEHLNKTYGYNYNSVETRPELLTILEFAFIQKSTIKDNMVYDLSGDAYFKLLEYEELSFARKNAREARQFSIAAIVIAILSGILQLFS